MWLGWLQELHIMIQNSICFLTRLKKTLACTLPLMCVILWALDQSTKLVSCDAAAINQMILPIMLLEWGKKTKVHQNKKVD